MSRGDIFSRLPPHQREIFERMRRGLDEEEKKPAPAKKAQPGKGAPCAPKPKEHVTGAAKKQPSRRHGR